MAKIKINAIYDRMVDMEVTWDNGFTRSFGVNDVPVEDYQATFIFLTKFIENVYASVVAEEAAKEAAKIVYAPEVLAAIGHTFDDKGNVIE